tara:strand:+ start:25 stop:222 length:198 start_codon:yes stop_codon:yes gene_type:complete
MITRPNRLEVDALLKQNARNVSNFGTGGKYDLKTKEAYDKAWKDIEDEIMELDPVIGKVIALQDD